MFKFLRDSINLANNHNYLDRLYSVYPVSTNIRRNIAPPLLDKLKFLYDSQKNKELIKLAIKLDLFPIKDSYVAFLRRCPSAVDNNPQTVNRIAGTMYEMGWDKFLNNITEPKEPNRQLGTKFSEWINTRVLGINPVCVDDFMKNDNNAILKVNDKNAMEFAKEKFNYTRNKGLDFIARFNGVYIIGEAKFLTDFGGHQNAQFEDALATLDSPINGAISVAILDGVIFLATNNKMHAKLLNEYKNKNILSALLLRDFCYSIIDK